MHSAEDTLCNTSTNGSFLEKSISSSQPGFCFLNLILFSPQWGPSWIIYSSLIIGIYTTLVLIRWK